MKKADSERYLIDYEIKKTFLGNTTGMQDLISPVLFALPDVQDSISKFFESTDIKSFDEFSKKFRGCYTDMKYKNMAVYNDIMDVLNHTIGRFFFDKEDLPKDITVSTKIAQKPIRGGINLVSDSIITDFSINPNGFTIVANSVNKTTQLTSNFDKKTLTIQGAESVSDHAFSQIEFNSVKYSVQDNGVIIKHCTDTAKEENNNTSIIGEDDSHINY